MENKVASAVIEEVRGDLLDVIMKVDAAKATRGQPGGMANKVTAEIAAGRLIALHGEKILALMVPSGDVSLLR